mgnify:CR=1 FL=1
MASSPCRHRADRDPLGAMPKITSTATRIPSAAHSRSLRVRQMREMQDRTLGAPEDLLRHAWKHTNGGEERAGHARNSHTDARSSTRQKRQELGDEASGRRQPGDDRPAIVNAVAMPGIIVPKPPIVKIAANATSHTRPDDARRRGPVMIPCANIWKTRPFQTGHGQRRRAEHDDDTHVRHG